MNVHEFLKLAAAKTKALDNHPALKGKQKSSLPDKIQALIIKKKMQKTAAPIGRGVAKALTKTKRGLGQSMPRGFSTRMKYGKPKYKLKPGESFGRGPLSDIIKTPLSYGLRSGPVTKPNARSMPKIRLTEVFSAPTRDGNVVQGPPARKVISQMVNRKGNL